MFLKLLKKVLLTPNTLRPGKNFGSGQLIFENWSGGKVDIFFTTTKFSKSDECQDAEMDADAEMDVIQGLI